MFLVAQALYYFLLANPSPAAGFLDYFVLNPVFQQVERQVCCRIQLWQLADLAHSTHPCSTVALMACVQRQFQRCTCSMRTQSRPATKPV